MELLFPLLLVALLVPMFLAMRRQKKEMAKTTEMQSQLKVGDEVLTTSGLWGTIVEVDDTTIDLEIAEDVVTTWSRAAVRELRVDEHEESGAADVSADTDAIEPSTPDKTLRLDESVSDTERRLNKE